MLVGLDVDRDGGVLVGQRRQVAGRHAGAVAAVQRVPHGADGQVRLVRGGVEARRDRVEPWLQRTQAGDELLGADPLDREPRDEVADVVLVEERGPGLGVGGAQVLQLLGAAQLGPVVEEARGRGGDLEGARQRLAERLLALLGRHRGVGRQRQLLEQRGDELRIVLRHDAERVAGLVGQARVLERELDVAGLLGRSPAGDHDVVEDRGRERVLLAVRAGRGGDAVGADPVGAGSARGSDDRRLARRDLGDDVRQPRRGVVLVVDVAVDAIHDPGGAELLEPLVDLLAGRAVVLVGRVAEGEHGEADVRQLRGLAALEELEEADRGRRRVALAVGRGDHDQVLRVLQQARLVVGHVRHRRLDADALRGLGQLARDLAAVAGVGAVEHRQRARGRRGDRHGDLGRHQAVAVPVGVAVARRCGNPAGGHAREVAAEPDRLVAVEGRR